MNDQVEANQRYILSPEVRQAHLSWLSRLTSREVRAAMDECDRLGVERFVKARGFSLPRNWIASPDGAPAYPAKAIACTALSYLPEGPNLDAATFFNGHGGIQSKDALSKLGYNVVPGVAATPGVTSFDRLAIEDAMDAFDAYRQTGAHSEVFGAFGEPRDYWVRSTRARENQVYPTKPIVGYLRGKTDLNGGWGQRNDAASFLHNAGFIIVDAEDRPVAPPERYEHLIRDADRIRLCARNYHIEPAREHGAAEVSIRSGDLAREMGLENAFPTICDALGGVKFQTLCALPPPRFTTPNPSSATTFTYALAADGITPTMTAPDQVPVPPTNLILYGPPGTGKTYATAWEAVKLCLGAEAASLENDRPALMAEYKRLSDEGRIEFTTFHQSMSYEDFVEGLRPETGAADAAAGAEVGFRLAPTAGLFLRLAERATAAKVKVHDVPEHSMSARTSAQPSAPTASGSDRAESTVTGDPEAAADNQRFIIGDWPIKRQDSFRQFAKEVAERLSQAHPDGFSLDRYRAALVEAGKETGIVPTVPWERHDMPSWASHPDRGWLVPVKAAHRGGDVDAPPPSPKHVSGIDRGENRSKTNFVLIIDEINRANISKVFGELITLLEPDKRLGAANEIRLRLPYSGRSFGVPANLHIIGTMNTADRSIALLDTALRRRFTFRELMPDASVLPTDCGGVNLQKLLATLNARIEYLFDREHQIGHAYFTACATRDDVAEVMRFKIIPLLAEYFYEDWSKVAAVLGDGPGRPERFLRAVPLSPPPGLGEDGINDTKVRWQLLDTFDFADFAA